MYHIKPFSNAYPSHKDWDDAFSEEELDYIQNLAKNAKLEGAVGGKGQVETKVRRTKVDWLKPVENNIFIFNKLERVVNQVNADYYHFSLHSFSEALQLTNYDSSELGHYSWHQDIGPDHSRKLSMVVQLTDPEEYEGGTLQFLFKDSPTSVEKKRGRITVFPSWMVHRVTPVVSGSRQTLVIWVTGEKFR